MAEVAADMHRGGGREEAVAPAERPTEDSSDALEEERKGGGVLGRLRKKLGRGRPPASLASQAVVDDFMAALRTSRQACTPPSSSFFGLSSSFFRWGGGNEGMPSHAHGTPLTGARVYQDGARKGRKKAKTTSSGVSTNLVVRVRRLFSLFPSLAVSNGSPRVPSP
jgi:hypothetical protein